MTLSSPAKDSATPAPSRNAILLIQCEDRPGLVSRMAGFIHENGGNIVHLDQYTDPVTNHFYMRLEWQYDKFLIRPEEFHAVFTPLARQFGMEYTLHFSDFLPRMAIFVSRLGHCFIDLLSHIFDGDIRAQVALVISNHPDMEKFAANFGIPYHYIPITKENKAEMEAKELQLLHENKVDLIVLARYMQILSDKMIAEYPNRIINIHHSFLPAFIGGKPYHQAYNRGVKLIGATSHYVTADLDEGPIIEQSVIKVTHRDAVEDLVLKGKDVEKVTLARAVRLHLQHRVLVHGNKTVVFE
jgi:formyltetrahydrofolate deformylase